MEVVSAGPWGYPKEGGAFDHRGYDGIKRVIVYCGWVIDSLKIQYTRQGRFEWTDINGGYGGGMQEIALDHPKEYLVGLRGYYGHLGGQCTINSLTFVSNLRQYGPFGIQRGHPRPKEDNVAVPFHILGGKIIGFRGTAGALYLSSIGFHAMHATLPLPLAGLDRVFGNPAFLWTMGRTAGSDDKQGVDAITVGLWGSEDIIDDDKRPSFNHNSYDGIKSIVVSHGHGGVDSIVVQYTDKNGTPEWTDQVGGDDECEHVDEVILDAPDEYLIAMTGWYESGSVNSLTFISNKRTHGPFGRREGSAFQVTGGKIVGFHGRGGKRLSAIGFHVMRAGVEPYSLIPIPTDDKAICN